jgi:hypothetical protein
MAKNRLYDGISFLVKTYIASGTFLGNLSFAPLSKEVKTVADP